MNHNFYLTLGTLKILKFEIIQYIFIQRWVTSWISESKLSIYIRSGSELPTVNRRLVVFRDMGHSVDYCANSMEETRKILKF